MPASFWVRRLSGNYTIDDLGITLEAGDYDLHGEGGISFESIQNSADLLTAFNTAQLIRITQSGGDTIAAVDAFDDAVQPHGDSHASGGLDELDVTGLPGVLADPQNPTVHTHAAADVTDFQAAVSNNTDVGNNTTHRNASGNPHGADTDDIPEGSNLYYTEGRVNANANVAANSAHRVSTSNPHGVTATQVGAIPTSEKGANNGVATLDGAGKVPSTQIPASALPSFSVVANAVARLALVVQEGDEAYQTDDGSQWVYDGTSWFQRPVGSGDVLGPSSATDNAVVRFDATTGKLIQNSLVTIDDSGNIATPGTVDGRDIAADGTKLDGIETGAEVDDKDLQVSGADSTPGFLEDKLVAGTGITLTKLNGGGNEQIRIEGPAVVTSDIAVSAIHASNLDLTTSFQNVPLQAAFTNPSEFTINANTITVLNSGSYFVFGHMALFQNGGNNRTTGFMQVTRNGSLVPGLNGGFYSRNNVDGRTTAAVGQFIALTAGDQIAIQGRQDSGSQDLFVESAGLTIFSLKGPKGDTGPAGGSTVAVQDEGSPLGSFSALDVRGAGIQATDQGGGVARLTVSDTTVFGNDQQYVESTTQASTTSTSWQNHLVLNIPAGLTGTYRLQWGATLSNTSTDGDTEARLYNDTDAVVLGDIAHIEPKDIDNRYHTGSVVRLTLTGTAKTIRVQFRSQESPGSATISRSFIEFWRVA